MEHKILVEFIAKTPNRFTFKKYFYPIQNKAFYFGVQITNLNKKRFTGGTLKNFTLVSKVLGAQHNFEEEFLIKNLNPNEEVEIWWPYTISTPLDGLVWVKCDIVSIKSDDEVKTFQQDAVTKVITSGYKGVNSWAGPMYVIPRFEFEQARTNFFIAILTLVAFLHGVFGLQNIAFMFIAILQQILLFLLTNLNKIPTH